jgi:hypothetical protein
MSKDNDYENRDKSLTKDQLEIVQNYLEVRLKEELSRRKYNSYRALARVIIERAAIVDGKREAPKDSQLITKKTSEGRIEGIDILVRRISEIRKPSGWSDVTLQEKVIQRLYKGLEEKKLTSDDIPRLENLANGDMDDRLGDRSDVVRVYFDLPMQTDRRLREFFKLNNKPQPVLICGFAFGRTLEQARKYIPQKIADRYTFHFLVFNPFLKGEDYFVYRKLYAYHYFKKKANEVDYNCDLSFKYLIQTMYYIKALYNKVNREFRGKKKGAHPGLIDRSGRGGKDFLGKKFQVAYYNVPLFYHGLFSNLPEDFTVKKKVDYQYHFITPEINECERSEHPFHFYRESDNLKPAIELYKTSVMKQWVEAIKSKNKFDESYTRLSARDKNYKPREIEERARREIQSVVEECKLGQDESIFDYFTW